MFMQISTPPAKQFTDGGLNELTVSLEAKDLKKNHNNRKKPHQTIFNKLLSLFLQGSITEASFLSQNSYNTLQKTFKSFGTKMKVDL